jgi:uncharacterized membrane protein
MKNFFNSLGFDITFIAGIAGGIVSLTKQKDLSFKESLIAVLSGGFTANYLTPLVAEWLNFSEKTLYGIAFLLGYTGLKTVEIIMKSMHKKLSSNNDKTTEN